MSGLFSSHASTLASAIDGLMAGGIGFALLIGVASAGLLGSLLLHRFFTKATEPSDRIMGMMRLGVVGVTFSLVLLLFSWSHHTHQTLRHPPPDALNFDVSLKYGLWQVSRFDGRSEVNELHIPVGVPVKLVIRSEEQPHTLTIPAFRLGVRVTPAKAETIWFQATQPGQYPVLGPMKAQIVALMPAAYEKWEGRPKPVPPLPSPPDEANLVATKASPTKVRVPAVVADDPALIKEGARQFKLMGCLSCHRFGAIEGGPLLQGVYGSTVELEGGATVVADDAYLRESILKSREKVVLGYKPSMPTFDGRISDAELNALVAYVKSLKKKGGAH